MPPFDLATAHKAARERLTSRATARAVRIFRQIPLNNLEAGWDVAAPQLLALGSAAQMQTVTQATRYVNRVAAHYGGAVSAALVPEAFAGVTSDGRELAPAAYGAITATKTLIGRGVAPESAFVSGAAFLATIFGAAIQDTGRSADMTLGTARGFPRYVRVIATGGCSRCAVLAGKSSGAVAFDRHPRCKCGVWLMPDMDSKTPEGMFDSPGEFFDSLTPAQQDKTFTKSGAFAIRNGADPVAVVNARRGALTTSPAAPFSPARLRLTTIGRRADGSPLQVYLTGEGTTARGAFGRNELRLTGEATREGRYRRTTTVRLMPEQILRAAGNNPTRARELLTKYGYIV